MLSIALPAILPPPVPLSPFVLVAGAVRMRRRTFMIAFTSSRLLRHVIACWLGVRYGAQVLRMWNQFSSKWAVTVLVVFWAVLIVFSAVGIWKLVQTSRAVAKHPGAGDGSQGQARSASA